MCHAAAHPSPFERSYLRLAAKFRYELTIPENFDDAWNVMETCRRTTHAQALQQASTENAAIRTDLYEEVNADIEKAFDGT